MEQEAGVQLSCWGDFRYTNKSLENGKFSFETCVDFLTINGLFHGFNGSILLLLQKKNNVL